MTVPSRRKPRPPLDEPMLGELALTYVGRFATTRAKLADYLRRKVRERGWAGDSEPAIDPVVERCVRNGFVDDSAFASAKARSLAGRGYGKGRLRQSLRAAGVADAEAGEARAIADAEAVDSAIRFARRRRIGPYAVTAADRPARERALAAMVRAGHPFGLSRAIVDLEPGEELPEDVAAGWSGESLD